MAKLIPKLHLDKHGTEVMLSFRCIDPEHAVAVYHKLEMDLRDKGAVKVRVLPEDGVC